MKPMFSFTPVSLNVYRNYGMCMHTCVYTHAISVW